MTTNQLQTERARARPTRLERATIPTGVERFFGQDEIIVSKTDTTGHITYANEIFCRIAGYTEAEVLGQPHSILRHPEMPRCVYKLLWEAIQGGNEIFAYIMNMTRNGDHYWVLAHVTPTFESTGQISGFHSNRRCPDRAPISAIRPLYQKLLDAERAHTLKADQMNASMAVLHKTLAELGATYEQFAFSVGRGAM